MAVPAPPRPGQLVGTIRHRLLINRLADPDEVAPRLPDGLRPHVTSSDGVVVGCCLIAVESMRPWPAPAAVGLPIRAAAHRISVEVDSGEEWSRAVYVPCRHADGLLPVLAGGRLFPGVHRRADIEIARDSNRLAWSISGRTAGSSAERFDITVEADLRSAVDTTSEVADVVIGTVLGLSPGHRDATIEAVDMCPTNTRAQRVELISLQSDFLNGFRSARGAETLLMTDVDVMWRRSQTRSRTLLPQ